MRKRFEKLDHAIISFGRKAAPWLGRISLFVVFFWFGLLKLFDTSPSGALVGSLLERTLSFLTYREFIVGLGTYEIIIGILFLIRGAERAAIALLVPHMITTCMPLILLPTITWSAPLVPTLEGQYIIKNLLIVALAVGIAAQLEPLKYKKQAS